MRGLTIKIATGNDAFVDDESAEIARILRDLAAKIQGGQPLPIRLMDLNGQSVGEATENV